MNSYILPDAAYSIAHGELVGAFVDITLIITFISVALILANKFIDNKADVFKTLLLTVIATYPFVQLPIRYVFMIFLFLYIISNLKNNERPLNAIHSDEGDDYSSGG
jgi:hypothetical protein